MNTLLFCERNKFESGKQFAAFVLFEYLNLPKEEILVSKHGKPYLTSERVFFSVSHTEEYCFIALSEKPIGLDAESENREIDFQPILKKFPNCKTSTIRTKRNFLKLWTASESAVKLFGDSLFPSLKRITFSRKRLLYDGVPLDFTFLPLLDHIICITQKEKSEKPIRICRV